LTTTCSEGLSIHSDELVVSFVSLRDARPLLIKMTGDGSGTHSAGAGGRMTIRTENLEVAGDFVQVQPILHTQNPKPLFVNPKP
jgi:hypothetical protein